MSIAGVVLAAGASTRLGTPKQLIVDAGGETLVHRAARQLVVAACAPVLVVVGAARDAVKLALADLPIVIVENDAWEEGVASSIRSAVGAARAHQHATGVDGNGANTFGAWNTAAAVDDGIELRAQDTETVHPQTAIDALLLTTCDMPTVGESHLRALCDVYASGAERVASRYVTPDGTDTIGIPAIVGAREWPLLDVLRGDRGAKQLFYNTGTATVDLVGGNFDIDTQTDAQALQDL